MDTNINEFCKKYILKLKNDKDISENKKNYLDDHRDRISFVITEYSITPSCHRMGTYHGNQLFTLDDEDLKYLYDKYSKKEEEEMLKNIEDLKKLYGR